MTDDRREQLIRSWDDNADLWTRAVREKSILSRRVATDAAVIDAVTRWAPKRVLDVGCGEGWLARRLGGTVPTVVGFDASASLIDRARQSLLECPHAAQFHVATFADLCAEPRRFGSNFDVIVANFVFLDDKVDAPLAALREAAAANGRLVIQTLHPAAVGSPWRDGWREESFDRFTDPGWSAMPWFFRTTGSWIAAIGQSWNVESLEEPLDPTSERPLSLLWTARPRG